MNNSQKEFIDPGNPAHWRKDQKQSKNSATEQGNSKQEVCVPQSKGDYNFREGLVWCLPFQAHKHFSTAKEPDTTCSSLNWMNRQGLPAASRQDTTHPQLNRMSSPNCGSFFMLVLIEACGLPLIKRY